MENRRSHAAARASETAPKHAQAERGLSLWRTLAIRDDLGPALAQNRRIRKKSHTVALPVSLSAPEHWDPSHSRPLRVRLGRTLGPRPGRRPHAYSTRRARCGTRRAPRRSQRLPLSASRLRLPEGPRSVTHALSRVCAALAEQPLQQADRAQRHGAGQHTQHAVRQRR